jgi:hypothetical protein
VSGWLDALLGRIRNAGTELSLGAGLNFLAPLVASRNTSTGFVDVSLPDTTSVVGGERAAITGAVEIPQDSNAAVFGASAIGSGLSGSGTAAVKYAGAAANVNSETTTGALGVVDITALECGGCVTFQSLSEATIDGFTAKTDGFWFILHVRDDTTSATLALLENVGDTTTSIRTPNIRDWRLTKNDSVILFYFSNRWRVVSSRSKAYVAGNQAVTWAAQQDNFARSGKGIDHLRVSLTGAQTLTGVVPDASANGSANGEVIVITNADSSDSLTIAHDATSTAANRFLCPASANYVQAFNTSTTWRYDATSSRWRMVSRS